MNSKERVRTTFQHKEPDRVPVFELVINSPVASKILGREAYTGGSGSGLVRRKEAESIIKGERDKFAHKRLKDKVDLYEKLGLDILPLPYTPQKNPIIPKKVERNTWIYEDEKTSEWTKFRYVPESDMCAEIDSNIRQKGMEEFERVTKLLEKRQSKKADLDHLLEALDYVQKRVGDKMFILGSADVSFPASTSWLPLFMESMVLQPELVERYLDATLEITLDSLRAQIKKGIDGVIGGADWASQRGMLFSPAHFRRYILPRLKIITAECHKHNLPYIKHTDGNIKSVEKEFLIESDIDGYQAIEPVAGMDIGELKKKYGHRITLLGNIDCSKTLVYGKKEDIVNEVKQCISKAAPGGGYVLSSSNSIHSQVPVKNFLIMLNAARKYGNYPINLTA